MMRGAAVLGLALGLATTWSPQTFAQRSPQGATYAYSFQVHRDGQPFTGVLDVYTLSPTEGCHEDVPVYGGQARVDIELGDLDGGSFEQESYQVQLALRLGEVGRCEDEQTNQAAFYDTFTALDPDYADNLRAYRNNGQGQSYHPVLAAYGSATGSSLDLGGDLEAEAMVLGDVDAQTRTQANFASLQVGSLTRVSLRQGGALTLPSGSQGGLAWGSAQSTSARWAEEDGAATLQADAGLTQGLRLRYGGATLATLGAQETTVQTLTLEDDLEVEGALLIHGKEANGVLFELEDPVGVSQAGDDYSDLVTQDLGQAHRRACFLTGAEFETDDYLDGCYIEVVDGRWQVQARQYNATNNTIRATACYARCLTW
jgi:hypothetical protein